MVAVGYLAWVFLSRCTITDSCSTPPVFTYTHGKVKVLVHLKTYEYTVEFKTYEHTSARVCVWVTDERVGAGARPHDVAYGRVMCMCVWADMRVWG